MASCLLKFGGTDVTNDTNRQYVGGIVQADDRPRLTKAQSIAMSAWHLFQLRGTWLEGGKNPFLPHQTQQQIKENK